MNGHDPFYSEGALPLHVVDPLAQVVELSCAHQSVVRPETQMHPDMLQLQQRPLPGGR